MSVILWCDWCGRFLGMGREGEQDHGRLCVGCEDVVSGKMKRWREEEGESDAVSKINASSRTS